MPEEHGARWQVTFLNYFPTEVSVIPLKDWVEHDAGSDECICGPRTEPVPREDGSIGWLITHHSLDGREFEEE